MRSGAARLLIALALASGGQPLLAAPPSRPDLLLEELAPQAPPARGQCALFLWARAAADRRIFMALDAPPVGRLRIGGRQQDLVRTAAGGDRAHGHHARQVFAGGGLGVQLDLDLKGRRDLIGGAVVPSGTLTLRDAEGWTTITPVAGLIACG